MNLSVNLLMKPHHFDRSITSDVLATLTRSGLNIEALRGKRILVTGGTGFFGVWLLSALVAIKNTLGGELDIVTITRSPREFLEKSKQFGLNDVVEFIEGDVKDVRFVGLGITHLVHMATTNASETFAGEDQLNKLRVLYEGTKNILEQCTSSLESVLFTSSGVVYGANRSEKITEIESTAPDTTQLGSALAIGKLTAEYLVAYYAERLGYGYTIARCFAFAGQLLPLNLHYAFGNFIQNAIDNRDIVIRGDGMDKRSYLYVGDAVGWLLRMIIEPKNQIINIGSERAISMRDLAELIAENSGGTSGVQVLGKESEVGNFKRVSYVPDTSKARLLYPGLDEWTPVNEITRKMLAYFAK